MEKFLSGLLAVILGFYLLGIVGRFLLRFWLRRKMKQFEQQAGAQGAQGAGPFFWTWNNQTGARSWGGTAGQQQSPTEKEGEVTITQSNSQKKVNNQVGEYVEYEDVKER